MASLVSSTRRYLIFTYQNFKALDSPRGLTKLSYLYGPVGSNVNSYYDYLLVSVAFEAGIKDQGRLPQRLPPQRTRCRCDYLQKRSYSAAYIVCYTYVGQHPAVTPTAAVGDDELGF